MTQTTKLRRITVAAAVVYGIILLLIAFWPTPVDKPAAGFLGRVLGWFANNGLGFITYDVVESLANVALFIPAGLLLVVLLGVPRWWLAVFFGVAASVVIEAGQAIFLAGRFATIDDVYANAVGTVIGAGVGTVALLRADRADAGTRRRASLGR